MKEIKNVRDWVHEGNVYFHRLGDQVFYFPEHGQVILGLDVFWVGGIKAGDEATQGSNPYSLADSKNS